MVGNFDIIVENAYLKFSFSDISFVYFIKLTEKE